MADFYEKIIRYTIELAELQNRNAQLQNIPEPQRKRETYRLEKDIKRLEKRMKALERKYYGALSANNAQCASAQRGDQALH